MKADLISRFAALAVALGIMAGAAAGAQAEDGAGKATQITPADLTWVANTKLPPGVESAVVWGDPAKPGLFTFRVRFPANLVVQPHAHPSDEYVTIISGTWHTASGETFDESRLQALPPGGFYMLPAGIKQFSRTGPEDVVIQVTAQGPWGVHFDEKHPAKTE